jgi:RNase P subunit RPR2
MNNIELRPIKRPGFCRGCDKTVDTGQQIVYTYSIRNRGQSILFCLDCAKEIAKLVKDK